MIYKRDMQTALFQKKIFFYTDTPIHGGAERLMLLLAKNLDKEKYQVQLVCSNYKQLNEWCKEWIAEGFKVHRLKVAHKHDPRHRSQLKKIIRKEKPHLVHVHLWNPGSCRYAFGSINKKNTKIITTEHDPFPLTSLKNRLKKKTLKKIDHVVAVSHANQELLLKLYPELKNKISTIHNGIDLEKFEKSLIHFSNQYKARIKDQLFHASNDDTIILSIAALHTRKGLNYLMEAFKNIHIKNPDTKLVIVGEGPERKNLTKLIKILELDNDVMLIGEQSDIPQILKSSDLFVLASVKEAFGLVLLEAMAAQVPIIASDVGGIPEIVQDNKSGLLVKPGNIEELTNQLQIALDNAALRQKLTYVASHRVKDFDIKVTAKKTEQLYDKILI